MLLLYRTRLREFIMFFIFPNLSDVKVPTDLVELQEIDLDQNLSYKEYPIAILDFLERKTRTKTIKLLKVQWSRHLVEKAT